MSKPVKFFEPVEGSLPKGFTAAYRLYELLPVERTFRHHPQRHNTMLYDAIADSLRNGRTVHFPLGRKRTDHPSATSFTFEKHGFKVLLPEPMANDTRVIICTSEHCPEDLVRRAAEHYAHLFVVEYRRFGSER